MTHRLQARSLSRAVAGRLPEKPVTGLILATFERACLLMPSGSTQPSGGEHAAEPAGPVALVLPEIGDGPLNVVVDARPGAFVGLDAGAPATLARDHLRAGGLAVNLAAARTWEPRPDWQALRAAWPRVRHHVHSCLLYTSDAADE